MSDSRSLEAVLQRYLDNRESLSDQEFAQLVEILRTQAPVAELLKDHLLMDELLAQQYQMDRKDFIGRFEARLRNENGQSALSPQAESSPGIYPLRRVEPAKTNGGTRRSPVNGISAPAKPASQEPKPKKAEEAPIKASPAVGTPAHSWRTFFFVMLGLGLIAAGLLRLEYTDAARKIGQLETVAGMVFIYRGDVGTVATEGMPVLPGDEIRVQAESSVALTFRDQSRVTLAPESRAVFLPGQGQWPGIIVHELPQEVSLLAGRMEAWIEPQPADRPLRIQTPKFAAKVLGTRLIATVADNQSRLEVLKGRVLVQSFHQNDPPMEIEAGYHVIASEGAIQSAPGEWPISKAGLAFLLSPHATMSQSANEGVQLFAEGPGGAPSILRPRKAARFVQGQMVFDGGAFLVDDSTASELQNACQRTNELTIEATFQTAELSQTGPAKWISFSTSAQEGNFALEQEGPRVLLRLRTSSADQSETMHEIPLFEMPDDSPHHVAVTYAPGELCCYLDGQQLERSATVQGTFAAWKPQHLLFGDEWTGGGEWRGKLSGVAVYHRAITPEEAARNALHFRLQFPSGSLDEESARE